MIINKRFAFINALVWYCPVLGMSNIQSFPSQEQSFSTSAQLTLGLDSSLLRKSSVFRRMFSSIPSCYPLGARNTNPKVVTIKNIFRYCQVSPGDAKCAPVGDHWSRITENVPHPSSKFPLEMVLPPLKHTSTGSPKVHCHFILRTDIEHFLCAKCYDTAMNVTIL